MKEEENSELLGRVAGDVFGVRFEQEKLSRSAVWWRAFWPVALSMLFPRTFGQGSEPRLDCKVVVFRLSDGSQAAWFRYDRETDGRRHLHDVENRLSSRTTAEFCSEMGIQTDRVW